MQSEDLIQSLLDHTRQIMNQAEKFKNYPLQALTWKEHKTSWSILECLEHLNLYGDYYLPEIKRKIEVSKTTPDIQFNSGFVGGFLAKSMLPKEKLNKMKTFKDKNPLNARLDKSVIDRFIDQQQELINLLIASREVSLNKVRIITSISSLIRMKLGDTFQFLINHNLRHLQQAEKVYAAYTKPA